MFLVRIVHWETEVAVERYDNFVSLRVRMKSGPRFWNSKRQLILSVLLLFCKSERNSFSGGRISALDSGLRITKRIHL